MEEIVVIFFAVIIIFAVLYMMISDIQQKRRDTKLKDFFKWLEEAPEIFGVKEYGMDETDWLPELDRWRAKFGFWADINWKILYRLIGK